MKSKIFIAGFVLLSSLFFAGITTVKSSDLFLQKTDGSGELYSTDNLRKIEFRNDELVVYLKSGGDDGIEIPYTALRYFTLKNSATSLPHVSASSLEVYPNPVADAVTVSSSHAITGLNLYNVQGQQILQLSPAGVKTVEVSVVALPAGIYFLRVTDEAGRVSLQKIIKK
jgi:hypothetical protein